MGFFLSTDEEKQDTAIPVIHVTMGCLKITMSPWLTYIWLCLCLPGFAMQAGCGAEPAHSLSPLPKLHQTILWQLPGYQDHCLGFPRQRAGEGCCRQTMVFLEQLCKECRENSIPQAQTAGVCEQHPSSSQAPLPQPLLPAVSASSCHSLGASTERGCDKSSIPSAH